jgi:hypothetical protein
VCRFDPDARLTTTQFHSFEEGIMCRRADIETKILSNITLEDHGYETLCHVWQGSHSGNGRGGGYPRMSLDGHTVAVHIVSFTNKNGLVPGKKQIDHKCNNRMCVNPDHLQMVTHKKNQKLRIERSRKDINALSPQHCQSSSHHAGSDDPRGTRIHANGDFQEDERQAVEANFDGRYLPDHAFWQTSSDVRSPSQDSASASAD